MIDYFLQRHPHLLLIGFSLSGNVLLKYLGEGRKVPGNISGALAGGLILGLAENFGALYLGPGLQNAVGYALLILVLFIRPSGLLGRKGFE